MFETAPLRKADDDPPIPSMVDCNGRLRNFLSLFLPLAITFLTLWQGLHYLGETIGAEDRKALALEATAHSQDGIEDTLRFFVSDLRVAMGSRALRNLVKGEGGFRSATESDFTTIVAAKRDIAQLRYLDARGHEVVRVDRTPSGVTSVDGPALQDKSHRYYFQRAAALADGGLYVSALDLNVERGVVELPWKPVLRLAAPMFTDLGNRAGVVVLNIAADRLLGLVDHNARAIGQPIQLLNAQGYWLTGVPSEQLWGFVFGRRTTIAEQLPAVWEAIAATDSGFAEGHGRTLVYRNFVPARALAGRSWPLAVDAEDRFWTVLQEVPDPSFVKAWQTGHLPGVAAGILAVAAISLGWSRARLARRAAEAERRRAEAELRRNERLAGLGNLVAGVAHELNTPIGNAVTVASTLVDRVESVDRDAEGGHRDRTRDDELMADVAVGTRLVLKSLQRAAELIRNFKQVAVDQASEQRRTFGIQELLDEVVGILRPQFTATPVALALRVETDARLDSYPGALDQVLANLVLNALRHGFRDGRPGTVTIVARDVGEDGPELRDAIEIAVEDDGCGIDGANLPKIFEPFFTTAFGSGGSGLGLSISHSIVTGVLGGSIRVRSEPDVATAVVLTIPKIAPATGVDRQPERKPAA